MKAELGNTPADKDYKPSGVNRPDKIYFPADGLPSYIDWDGSPIRTKQVEDSDVCYIRKDALLELINEEAKFWDDGNMIFRELIDKINSL